MNYKMGFMGYIDELVPFYSTNIPKDIYFMYVHCSQYRSSRIPRNSWRTVLYAYQWQLAMAL